jgi:hypothetical protein
MSTGGYSTSGDETFEGDIDGKIGNKLKEGNLGINNTSIIFFLADSVTKIATCHNNSGPLKSTINQE